MSIAFHFRSITLLLLFTLSLGVHAQFSVTGRVVNSSDNSGLPGATIELLGSNRGTVTDFNGNFTISEIVSQKAELRISYLGFRLLIEKLDFSDKKNLKVLIRLDEATADLKQVDVVAQSEGQVQAMLRQREANSIKNVISAEQIKQFPDVNAAEVVQRIPGITVQRDQGEGRFVQLRGTAPEFTNFSINGEQIASPEGGARYVGLDVIAADQIELIEVTKVPTPDMDGDGISGNVNIITRSARDTIPDIIASISGGYNNLMKTGNQQLQFSFGQRHKKLGVQINTSYYRNSQGSHNMEFDYTRGPLLSQAQDTTNKDNFYILYKDIELRHYTILRQRTGLSTNLDYRFNRNHQIYLRGMYNSFSDDEQRRRISYKFSDANDLLIYREASIEHDVKDRIKTQEISALNLGGEHVIGNGLKLDYEVAYSVASEKQPDRMLASFDNGGITMAIDNSDLKWPRISYPFYEDSLDAATLKNYEFNDLQFYKELTKDRTYTARFNLEIPYLTNSSSRHSGFLKFGAKFRMKEKVRENSARAFNKYFQKVSLYSQTGPVLNLTTIEDAFREDNLLNQAYDINHMIGVDNMREFYEKYPQLFKYDEIETWSRTYRQDYKAHEDIYALYGMFSHNIGKLLIIGGLRYEMTQIDNQGIDAGVDYPAGGILYADTIYDKRTQNFLLPQLQFKYALNPLTNFRAAITYTYTRPNFDDIIPFRESEDDEVTIGNPSLKYPLSMNIDLLAETYLKNNGILSGGVFYKKIENIAFNFVRNAHMGTDFNRYGLMEITMAVNGQDANVFGAETQAQFKLSFLPGLLANLGIYGNYTFTQSSATITKRYPQNENNKVFIFNEDNAEFFTSSGETETIQMPGQAQHAGNFALYYDNKRIYAKLSANFHSPYLIELGNDAGLDVYYDQSFHLDFNANYQVNKVLNIFADVVNLTNEPQRYYMGSTDYFKKQEYYSWWGRLGLKINLLKFSPNKSVKQMKKRTIGLLLTFLALAFMFQACNNNSKPEADNYPGVIDSSSQIIKPVYISERSLNDTDDPAIWINPVDPSQSLILGTDKGNLNGGIYVYDLEGKIDSARSIFNLKRPNNIDVEYGFPYKGGKTDIAVFTERGRNMIRVYSLPDMMAIDNGGIEVFASATDRDPMGIGIYHDKSASKFYAVVSRKSGPDGAYLWQYELREENGIVAGTKVREFGQFKGKNEIEALVVDDELGYIYYSDEGVGVRQYFASPDRGNDELSVFATSGIKEDHEGLSIYKLTDTTGYILLSDQAAGRFHIFSREGTKDNPYEHRLLKIIGVEARDSDGSDVTSVAVNSTFKHGLFVVMSTDKTFHYYRWEDIAGKDLKMKWTDL